MEYIDKEEYNILLFIGTSIYMEKESLVEIRRPKDSSLHRFS